MISRVTIYLIIVIGLIAIMAAPSFGATEECNSLREARRLHPNVYLVRRKGCWMPRNKPMRSIPEKTRAEAEPPPWPNSIHVIQPWTPVTRSEFAPWDERIEPNLHQGAK